MRAEAQDNRDERILILAPTGRDATLTAGFLRDAGLDPQGCTSVAQLCHEVNVGAGLIFLTGETLTPEAMQALVGTLSQQPAWSDVPLIVLTSGGGGTPANAAALAVLSEAGNVTFIERPVRVMTLMSAVRAALRARRHQYDVRERLAAEQRAKEALAQSEQRLRIALDAGQLGAWQLDLATNQLECTARCKANFGLPPDAELSYEGLIELIYHEDRERTRQEVARALADRELYQTEYRVVWPDGSLHWVSASGRANYGAAGEPYNMVGTTLDITERKQAEAKLRESEARFAKAFSASPLVLTISSLTTGRLLEVNDTFVNVTGISRAEAIGRTTIELGLWVKPHEREAELRHVRQTGRVRNAEYLFRVRNGREIVGLLSAEQIEIGGESFALTVIQDITARKQAEESVRESERQLRTLADAVPQLVWMAEPSGHIFWYNQRWYEYTGTTSAAMAGWGWQRVHDPEILPHVIARWRASLETGEPFEMEFPLKGADGVFRWFLTRVNPLRDAHGRIVRWFGTNTDVDEQRRTAEELRTANRLKDEFLATVSHELRTPLTAMLGWAHMLRVGQLDEHNTRHAVETIERNARAQSQLIDDLLDVSRIITGKLRLDVRQVEPGTFIEAAIEAVRPAAEAKEIQIQKVLDTGVNVIVGDPARLQQVVWNLLSNAIKFTPKAGRVEVRLARVNSHVEIAVSDSGVGIEPEFLPHVFERFRQADQTTTRHYGGLGLGLAIVRHLVELHGGSVEAASAGDGHGATFIVTLPLVSVYQRPDPDERGPRSPGDVRPVLPCTERLDGLKVLVVDDEADARELLGIGLGQCGAGVTVVGSVREALAAVAQESPDLLISDIGMPGEDGYELIRRVRALPPEQGGRVPAIALTAYARAEDRTEALRAGYQLHVPKPVELAELVAAVASLVSRSA